MKVNAAGVDRYDDEIGNGGDSRERILKPGWQVDDDRGVLLRQHADLRNPCQPGVRIIGLGLVKHPGGHAQPEVAVLSPGQGRCLPVGVDEDTVDTGPRAQGAGQVDGDGTLAGTTLEVTDGDDARDHDGMVDLSVGLDPGAPGAIRQP